MRKLASLLLVILTIGSAWAQSEQSQSGKSDKKKTSVGLQLNIDVEGNMTFVEGFKLEKADQLIQADSYIAGGVSGIVGLGVRVGRFLYLGVASGAEGEWGETEIKSVKLSSAGQDIKTMVTNASAWIVPLYGDIRLYLPTNGRCYPFLEAGFGGYWGMDGVIKAAKQEIAFEPEGGGFYMITGAGLEFKRLTLGLGYKLLRHDDINANHAYVKLGVSLGRPAKLRR